jgi:hypothetical protein
MRFLPSVAAGLKSDAIAGFELSCSHSGLKKRVPVSRRLLRNRLGKLLTAVSNAVESDTSRQDSRKPA